MTNASRWMRKLHSSNKTVMYTKWHSKCSAERKIAATNSFGFVTRAKQICRQREDASLGEGAGRIHHVGISTGLDTCPPSSVIAEFWKDIWDTRRHTTWPCLSPNSARVVSLSPVWYSAVVCNRRYNPPRYTRFNPSLNPTSGDSYNVSAKVRSFPLTCPGAPR